jgi:hypothetical protein
LCLIASALASRNAIIKKFDLHHADFHSLRHTTGTLLASAGVHPKVAQSIMRHSTIDLTMSRYMHTLIGQERTAVESLPDLSASSSQQHKAVITGTDGKNVLAFCLAREGSETCDSVHNGA